MFPTPANTAGYSPSFPRVSGDVPQVAQRRAADRRFSPRERGCSPGGEAIEVVDKVFPA